MNDSLISIIIPVYNHARTLQRCLKSIAGQTYRPLQVILINDGSTDNFNDVVTQLSSEEWFKQLNTKIVQQPNRGASAARNRGFKEANGDYLIFWDADVMANPAMLAKLHQALITHPAASYAYSQMRLGWKKMKSQPFNAKDLQRYNYIDMISLIRREDFSGFDESLKRFQDWDLWLTLLEHGKIGTFIPEVLKQALVARPGMSAWRPRFLYRLPWKPRAVKAYEAARRIIFAKHHLVSS